MRQYDLRTLAVAAKRLGVCGVAALALAHIQVAQASKLPDFSRSGVSYTGKSATFGMTGGATSYGSTLPVSPTLGGGWQFAGNYGIPQPATGPTMTMSAKGDVFFAGTKYPFQAGYAVPKANIVDGMMALAGGPLGLALFALPYAFDWLTKAGGRTVTDPSGKIVGLERKDTTVCTVSPCYEYQNGVAGWTAGAVWHATKLASCQYAATQQATTTSYYVRAENPRLGFNYGQDVCLVDFYRRDNGSFDSTQDYTFSEQSAPPQPANWLPSSMDDIAPYMKSDSIAPDGRVVQELLDKGVDFTMPNPTVTGPSSIEGPTKETANPDGSKTVEKTTYNFNTSGNTITNTTNNTTTTIFNTDNSVRSTTNTTNAPTDEEQIPKDCDKDSSTVGCSKTDVPEDKIPKAEKSVTYAPENLGFGSGQCPAPIGWSDSLGSHQIDLASYCNMLTTWVKPVVIALALMLAFFIVAPIKGD